MEKVKVGSTWKDIIGSFIKVNGKWAPVTKTLLKVNGKWEDTSGLEPTEPEQYSYHMPAKRVGSAFVLDDMGKYPKQPATLMSGNHLDCNDWRFAEVPIAVIDGLDSYATIYDVASKQFKSLSVSIIFPKYRLTIPFSQYFTHTKALSQADFDALNANPNLLADVWINGAVLPSGFKKSDMVDYFPAIEGTGSEIYNEKDGSSILIDPSARDKYKNVSFGMQNFFLELDDNGRMTASLDSTKLRGGSDGRYLKIGSDKQLITKSCVTDVKGDIVGSLTETECKP